MIEITPSIAEGSGTLPKGIDINSTITLSVPLSSGSFFEWEIITKPEESSSIILVPNSNMTKLVLDKVGVYSIRAWVDKNAITQKIGTITLNVPGSNFPIPNPPQPDLMISGRVQNGTFELAGVSPGWALYWTISDTENILAYNAGVNRGRIQPANFTVTKGNYAMCLGDDINASYDFKVGGVFEVSQNIDFTGMKRLSLDLKFNDGED